MVLNPRFSCGFGSFPYDALVAHQAPHVFAWTGAPRPPCTPLGLPCGAAAGALQVLQVLLLLVLGWGAGGGLKRAAQAQAQGTAPAPELRSGWAISQTNRPKAKGQRTETEDTARPSLEFLVPFELSVPRPEASGRWPASSGQQPAASTSYRAPCIGQQPAGSPAASSGEWRGQLLWADRVQCGRVCRYTLHVTPGGLWRVGRRS
jgi:hypothetical protein